MKSEKLPAYGYHYQTATIGQEYILSTTKDIPYLMIKEEINKYKTLRRSRRKVQERVKCLILKDVFEQRRISLDLNVNKSEEQEVDHRLTQYFFLKTEIINVNNHRN